ncbi:MAG: lipoate protein ligase C-terminal domain-containing protein [Thermodesulfobacteriota bacterium]
MELFNLGKVPWEQSQLIYHALAELDREALSLVSPASPYVCLGFHQDARQEVDLEYCHAKAIPVFRREVGGGAVYLDGDQLFFHLILLRDNPLVPKNKEAFYRKFLRPVIEVYRRIGIPAEYKPINDVIVGSRKISGTGVGEIGDCVVFVGNLIVDFNYDLMARVLKVPDEKFRDKVHKTLKDNLSTIRRELGLEKAAAWDEAILNGLMVEEFTKLVGPMTSIRPDDALKSKMRELKTRMVNDEWLLKIGRPKDPGRQVKIRSGAEVRRNVYKSPGGLIRADLEVLEGRLRSVDISGDFFMFPREALSRLEERLEGRPVEELEEAIERFYAEERVETPGVAIADWLAVMKA